MKRKLSANSQSVVNSGITDDYKQAITEYIWNGFDAKATVVDINYVVKDELGNLEFLIVIDNGNGIKRETLECTFGAFLDSQKKRYYQRTSEVRGKKGKGRFSFMAFADRAIWKTRYLNAEGILMEYTICIDVSDLSDYEISDEYEVDASRYKTGTEVSFLNLKNISVAHLEDEAFFDFLSQQYAWFLCLNSGSDYKIRINGDELEYEDIIAVKECVDFSINEKVFNVTYIRWGDKIGERCYYYMLNQNLHEVFKIPTSFNNNTIEFNHSVFVESSYFNDFYYEENPQTRLDGKPNQIDATYKNLLKKLKEFLSKKQKEYVNEVAAVKLINQYEATGVLPVFRLDPYHQMRRQDLIDTIKHIYIVQPKIFKGLLKEQQKTLVGFLNLLLDSDERTKILSILESIVSLSEEERSQLAQLLESTNMRNITRMVNLVHNRVKAIEMLRLLVNDYKKFTTERHQIQTIIENNFWLFGDSYQLVSADETFEKALGKYTYVLDGKDIADDVNSHHIDSPDSNRRPDIFMCRNKINGSVDLCDMVEEHIIVELKRPSVNVGIKQYRQIEDYFTLIKGEPRFNSSSRVWRFYVVSTIVEEEVKAKYESFKPYNKRYLVYKEGDYEIYAMSWDDVFQEFTYKNQYILTKLNFSKEEIQKEIEDASIDAQGTARLANLLMEMDTN